jgi:hypothetical protein
MQRYEIREEISELLGDFRPFDSSFMLLHIELLQLINHPFGFCLFVFTYVCAINLHIVGNHCFASPPPVRALCTAPSSRAPPEADI